MKNFLDDLKSLESGDYTGITQVYFTIYHSEYNKIDCNKTYIVKHTNLSPDLIQEYLNYLVENGYVHRDSRNRYTTMTFHINRVGFEKIVKSFELTPGQVLEAKSLIEQMVLRQTDPNDVYSGLEKFLTKFRSYLNIRNSNDLITLLRLINGHYSQVSFDVLNPSLMKTRLFAENNHEMQRTTISVMNEQSQIARRVAIAVKGFVKRNPELFIDGKLSRAKLEEFLRAHYVSFPQDRVVDAILEKELNTLSEPIYIGD